MFVYLFVPDPVSWNTLGFVAIVAQTYLQAMDLYTLHSTNIFKPKLVRIKPTIHAWDRNTFILTDKIPTLANEKPRVVYIQWGYVE